MAERQMRVLSLDGGGVRGLSTLLILRDLLCKTNKEVTGRSEPMLPKEVFDVIIGTSTGGLIALLIVKLGLDVDQCIEQYKKLSKEIFGKPHQLGKWTAGIVRPRYSGQKVRGFVIDLILNSHRGEGEDLMMEDTLQDGGIHCTVVCRELEGNWTKARRSEPVFLCSHKCRGQPGSTYRKCKVCDAACATSAAPTYFEPRNLLNKTLVDGGFGETNNPSSAALEHYRIENKSWSLPLNEHLIWINIGTGSPPAHMSASHSKRPLWTRLVPNFILDPYHLMNDMQKMATDSEQVVRNMKRLAKESHGYLQYSRFSADNGLHMIGLDDFEKVDDGTMEDLTLQYLKRRDIQAELTATAKSLAQAYKQRRVEIRRASEARSPVRGGNSPILPSTPQLYSPVFPDDLSAKDLPALSKKVPTDEASEPPRTPQPSSAYLASGTKPESTDTVGSGHQFPNLRPQLRIIINGEDITSCSY